MNLKTNLILNKCFFVLIWFVCILCLKTVKQFVLCSIAVIFVLSLLTVQLYTFSPSCFCLYNLFELFSSKLHPFFVIFTCLLFCFSLSFFSNVQFLFLFVLLPFLYYSLLFLLGKAKFMVPMVLILLFKVSCKMCYVKF